MIRIEHIKKQYKQSNEMAIKDISTVFESGLIHGIVGVSGAGKSTLIRLFNQLETYDDGVVSVFEYPDIKKLNKESTRMLRKRIGMIFQSDHLLQRKTVLENVLLPLTFHQKITDKDRIYAKTLLEEVGLASYVNRYPAQLSGGQRQRVGIARALINQPELLLCDEPTSALDVMTTYQILTLIKTMAKNHDVNVIIVTHDMSVVKEICDTVTVMDKGLIVENGYVDDILFKAKHPQTKAFVKDIGLDLSPLSKEISHEQLLLLKFPENIVEQSIISDMIKTLNVDVSIVYASVTPHKKGVMVLYVAHDKEKVITYLKKHKVDIDYVV